MAQTLRRGLLAFIPHFFTLKCFVQSIRFLKACVSESPVSCHEAGGGVQEWSHPSILLVSTLFATPFLPFEFELACALLWLIACGRSEGGPAVRLKSSHASVFSISLCTDTTQLPLEQV